MNPPSKRYTASDYLSEVINYGGTQMSRGEAYKELLKVARAQGFKGQEAQTLADRWMQGYDSRHRHGNPDTFDGPPDPAQIADTFESALSIVSDPVFAEGTPETQAAILTAMEEGGGGTISNPTSNEETAYNFGSKEATQSVRRDVAGQRFTHEQYRKWLHYRTDKSEHAALDAAWRKGYETTASEMRSHLRNPRGGKRHMNPEEAAAELSHKWTGREPEHVTEYVDSIHVHEVLTELGDLVEIDLETESGYRATLSFKGEGLKLASSESGQQLFIQGQTDIDLRALHMSGAKWKREFMALGRITALVYRARKEMEGGQLDDYIHKAGESLVDNKIKHVTDVYPILTYDTRNRELGVVGGQMHVDTSGDESVGLVR